MAESALHFESELAPDVPAVEVAAGEECFAVLHRVWRCVAARSHALRPSVARGRHSGSPRASSANAQKNTRSHSSSADAVASPAAHNRETLPAHAPSPAFPVDGRAAGWPARFSGCQRRLPLPSVACTSSKDLQHRWLSDSCVADRLLLALPAIAVARASVARPGEALLSYPSRPSRRGPPLVDEKPECGPSAKAFCRGLSACLPRCASQAQPMPFRSWPQSGYEWLSLSPSVRPCDTGYRSLRRLKSGSASPPLPDGSFRNRP